ncbi:MAG: alpha/beta hydrolase, partial [Pseudomonadota bacterium]|nr:alpha/beta hydrolase [Pseudomonadota bacterium]
MITHPSRAYVGPAPADLDAEEVTFPSTSGATIHGWYIRGQPHEGAVLLLHGVHANRLVEIGRERFLHKA